MTKILVIEDEVPLLEEIAEHLTFAGFQVHTASGGLEGVKVAHQYHPDVIICDITMPELDGYGVLTELRQASDTMRIPFIFLTAKTDPHEIRAGMTLGADDYLTKPFAYTDLLSAIQTRLDRFTLVEVDLLRSLTQQLVVRQNQVRRGLAHRLQQEIGQSLTNLRIMLTFLKNLPKENYQSGVQEVQNGLDRLIQQFDLGIMELYPTLLDRLGLLPALFWHFEQFTQATGVQVHFHHKDLDIPLSASLKIGVYQIIQEALANIAAHAQVQAAYLNLWVEEQHLKGSIEDQGCGFNLGFIFGQKLPFGLLRMQAIAQTLGGELSIVSTSGTKITFELPLWEQVLAPLVPPPGVSMNPGLLLSPLTPPEHSSTTIKVVVADENELVRQGLQHLITAEPDFTVVGAARDLAETLDLTAKLSPHVVVFDLGLLNAEVQDGLHPITQLAQHSHVLVLSPHSEDVYAWEALQQGALGCLLKKSCADELTAAVRQVYQGQRYLSAELSSHAAESYIKVRTRSAQPQDAFETLTEREREVFYLIARDYTNAQIAEKLTISVRTVETHRANLMRKLELHDKVEFMRYALKKGVISLGDS